MFTGIVEARVAVQSFDPRADAAGGGRLVLPAPTQVHGAGASDPSWAVSLGDSVAVSGCCLTVAELAAGSTGPMAFDLSEETLERTWFRSLTAGTPVNLERALRVGDRLGGHMVQGHVDGAGILVASEDSGDGGWSMTFEVEPGFERYLVSKGSVTIDGISLTVVEPGERRFSVALIPLTMEITTLGTLEVGAAVNLEADMVGKWIEHLVRAR